MVLETLKDNQLFVKQSKCSFYEQQMVYVVHIISLKGITIDLRKTKVVKNWPIPHSIKELRGFL